MRPLLLSDVNITTADIVFLLVLVGLMFIGFCVAFVSIFFFIGDKRRHSVLHGFNIAFCLLDITAMFIASEDVAEKIENVPPSVLIPLMFAVSLTMSILHFAKYRGK